MRERRCRPPPSPRASGLDTLVAQYIEDYREYRRASARRFAEISSLSETVRSAALSLTPEGKRHPHQRRIPAESLREAARRLEKADLDRARSFDELHERIASVCAGIDRFGKLTRYDVATRIGAHLGIEPVRVYLHRGTQDGAKALGLNHRKPSLDPAGLPAPLQKLSASEIEDFLCIYKDEFARARGG